MPFSSVRVSGFVWEGDSMLGMGGCEEAIGGMVGIGKSLCMI
jgi:hypothetical protein